MGTHRGKVREYGYFSWVKVAGTNDDGDPDSGIERCNDFEKEFWFDLGKSMWRNHWSTFQYHAKYIHNDIMKTL